MGVLLWVLRAFLLFFYILERKWSLVWLNIRSILIAANAQWKVVREMLDMVQVLWQTLVWQPCCKSFRHIKLVGKLWRPDCIIPVKQIVNEDMGNRPGKDVYWTPLRPRDQQAEAMNGSRETEQPGKNITSDNIYV